MALQEPCLVFVSLLRTVLSSLSLAYTAAKRVCDGHSKCRPLKTEGFRFSCFVALHFLTFVTLILGLLRSAEAARWNLSSVRHRRVSERKNLV